MLYDLGTVPKSKSLLESVLMMIANRRQYQEFLKTRVIMDASLAPHIEKGIDRLDESYQKYAKVMMPYLGKTRSTQTMDEQKQLDQWTNRGPLVVRPLWQAKTGARQWRSALARGKEKVAALEEARRLGHLRRIG